MKARDDVWPSAKTSHSKKKTHKAHRDTVAIRIKIKRGRKRAIEKRVANSSCWPIRTIYILHKR